MIDFSYDLLEHVKASDITGLTEAYDISRLSDHSTQVGAAVGAAYGYNKVVSGVRMHAESLTIIENAKHGISLRGRTMYAPWASCPECAADIIVSGIGRVVVHHERMQMTCDRWIEQVKEGVDMLLAAGVRVEAVSHHFGKKITVDGTEVTL